MAPPAKDKEVETVFDESFIKEEEGASAKFARKSKEFPFMPIGIAGAIMGVMYGAYKFRKRGEMSTSIFLIHLRLAAQGTVVSALSLGVIYSLAKEFISPEPPPRPIEHSSYHPKPHPVPEVHHPNYEKPKEK